MNKKAYKFGVEIECGIPQNVECEDLQDELHKLGCEMKGDGSLSFSDAVPWEIITKPLGYNAMQRTISKVGGVLSDIEATANKSCGLHIHTSNKRFFLRKNLKKIMAFWIAIEDVLFSTQPEHRLTNRYCNRLLARFVSGRMPENLPAKKDRILEEAENVDRYCAFNLNSLGQGDHGHGTLEVRLFAGTCNAKKINAYLELTRAIFDYCLSSYDPKEVHELFGMKISELKIKKVWAMLELTKKTRDLLNTRVEKNLFSTLARQQDSAIKYTEIKPNLEKVKKEYLESQTRYDDSQRQLREVTRPFGSIC